MVTDAATRTVRGLAAAIPGGGDEAIRATRALGLLIEREQVPHPAGGDVGLEELFGSEPVPRLTPLAMYEAVDLLIAHLTAVRIPAPDVVWALTRSVDPRIVPHLAALLGRVVDNPVHQAVASQVVSGLTCYRDARSVVALRLAAERGHGDARERATRWLSLHDTGPIPIDTAKPQMVSSSLSFDVSAYHLQRRPGTAQVIINDSSGGVIVIDATTGTEAARAAFSPGFPRDGVVRQWCLSANGSEAAVFADDGVGSLVSLISGISTDLSAPLNGDVDDLRYLWDDRLIVAAGEVATLFGLSRTGGIATFDKLRSLEVRRDHRGWMRCVDAAKPLTSRVIRTEPHEHRILAYDFASSPELVVLGPGGESEFRVPAPQFVRSAAYRPGQIFVLHDHEVQAIDAHGAVTNTFPAPDDTYLRALDIVADMLVILATRLDGPRSSVLLAYDLTRTA